MSQEAQGAPKPAPNWLRVNGLAFASLVTAIGSLYVSSNNVGVAKRTFELNHTPILILEWDNTAARTGLSVRNVGTGNGVLRRLDFRLDGTLLPPSDNASLSLAKSAVSASLGLSGPATIGRPNNRWLTSGAQSLLYGADEETYRGPTDKLSNGQNTYFSDRRQLNLTKKRLTAAICYCSVTGECWTSTYNGFNGDPVPVANCSGSLPDPGRPSKDDSAPEPSLPVGGS